MGRAALVAVVVLAAVTAAVPARADQQATTAATFQECALPSNPESFLTGLRVLGTSCRTGRQVVTHMKCLNLPICDKLRHKKWLCHVKGGIAFRTTKCRRGADRIVATAAGD